MDHRTCSRVAVVRLRIVLAGWRHGVGCGYHRRDDQEGRCRGSQCRRCRAHLIGRAAVAAPSADHGHCGADRAAQQQGVAGGLQRIGIGGGGPGAGQPAAESDLLDLKDHRQRRQRNRTSSGGRHPGAGDPAVSRRNRPHTLSSGAIARGTGNIAARE